MSRVDELSHTLVIADGSRIHFNKVDVARVFGIPSAGMSIFSKPANIQCCISDLSPPDAPLNAKHFRSIKVAQGIVSREIEGPMSAIEQGEFRAAFVVFVLSTLLAPCAKHDRVSDDYMHAIQNPAQIRFYDWAEYVLRRLLDAVAKLKSKSPIFMGAHCFYRYTLFY